ncbi:MAG: AmmeMemoRadiSam system protein B [Planctomycetaceae bacterium]|jgi:AmmeMemoRadiSam system protein B/AmmeMemoRadiSam system protein A|nr:AmmeMemoRadiSam system protein B [Planctomycetaceae bacterium]
MGEPYISEEQQVALFHAVGRRIASIVTNTSCESIRQQVSEVADVLLLGAFVSLKNNGELRSCMGIMSDQISLGEAVEQASIHAAKDDPRFPPISAAELFELDMEIWLLWGMRRVAARGESRLDAVVIGEHGVQISHGGNRGLLLPGVAIEYGMDSRQFLEAVCRKAGLPTDAWLDDRSLLHTFEGRAIRGPFSAANIDDKKTAEELIFAAKFQRPASTSNVPALTDAEDARNICIETFRAMTENLSPPAYFPGLYDGNVSGVIIEFRIPDRPPIVCSKISVRPDVQFQPSVLELLKVLGYQVVRLGVTFYDIRDFSLNLAIFWDPQIHGNVNCSDLSSVDTENRCVLVTSRNGWSIRYDNSCTAEELVRGAADMLDAEDLDLCDVVSFRIVATMENLSVSASQKTQEWNKSRASAVAGMFYPSDVAELNAELDQMLSSSRFEIPKVERAITTSQTDKSIAHVGNISEKKLASKRVSAVLVPHAGWRYSGRLVAETLSSVEIPERVIIFAPKHRAGGIDWSIAPNLYWELPDCRVESDLDLAGSIMRYVDLIDFDEAPHAGEHAIEVLLPILHRLSPKTKIIGIVMATSSWAMIQAGAKQFSRFMESLETKPLLVVSSDMNHFASEEMTRKIDRTAIDALKEAVAKSKPDILLETVMKNQISMCGIVPMVFVLEVLRCMGGVRAIEEIGYTTSAESSGDIARVVGYCGCIIT